MPPLVDRAILLVVGCFLLVGCQEGPRGGGGADVLDLAEPPTVDILSPTDGTVVMTRDVTVRAAVDAWLIADRIGEERRPGEGHLIYYLDIEQIPVDPDQPALVDDGSSVAVADRSHTWTDLEPGRHVFTVQLVYSDNTPLDPPVFSSAIVTVRPGEAT